MSKLPQSLRKQVVLVGNVNAGKSSLFNKIVGQDSSIVSPIAGTSTDALIKSMELVPFGPITLIDTAGLSDPTLLGKVREEKTRTLFRRADVFIYVLDGSSPDFSSYDEFKSAGHLHLLVVNKSDLLDQNTKDQLLNKYLDTIFTSSKTGEGIPELRSSLLKVLESNFSDDKSLISDLIPAGSNVVFLIHIDSAAPKSRLILPQQMILKECVDNGILVTVATLDNIKQALSTTTDLVIVDSQIFPQAKKLVPESIPLCSFSLLLARQNGVLQSSILAVEKIQKLKDNDKILVLEGCSHNQTHEDIGRVKLPAALEKNTGKKFDFTFFSGYDFPENLKDYSLAFECGGCMLGKSEKASRTRFLAEANVPAVNYGVALAYFSGALNRAEEFLDGRY